MNLKYVVLALGFLLGGGLFLSLGFEDDSSVTSDEKALLEPGEVFSKAIHYRLEVSNPSNKLVENAFAQLALPAVLARQKIKTLKVSTEYQSQLHNEWNQSLKFTLSPLTPYETRIIDIRVDLSIDKIPKQVIARDFQRFLQAEKYLEYDHPKLQRIASTIHADTELETAREIYKWVSQHLAESGFVEPERGALYALDQQKGDCTEHMYLFGALARAKGIPSRMMSGFVVESNKMLKVEDYHNWVEIYIDGAWRVVDTMNKHFLENEDYYIAMKVTESSKADSFVHSQQLFIGSDDLKIRLL